MRTRVSNVAGVLLAPAPKRSNRKAGQAEGVDLEVSRTLDVPECAIMLALHKNAVYPARCFEQALADAQAGGKVLLDFTE